jgi:hypothetical protein
LLVSRNVLSEEEVKNLKAFNSNLSESLWTWIYAIVMKLHKEGKVKSQYTLWKIIDSVKKGRSGAATIGSQMGTPLPVQYVHILGFMVKLHNMLNAFVYGVKAGCDHIAVSSAASSAEASAGFNPVGPFHQPPPPPMPAELLESFLLACLPPLLYNAILIINGQLANPFAKGRLAFPAAKYDKGIESDGLSYIQAGQNLPEWITQISTDDDA